MPQADEAAPTSTGSTPQSGSLIVDKNVLINRGIESSRPKRLNMTKAAITLVRQVARRAPEMVDSAYMVDAVADASKAHDLLRDFKNVTMTSHSVGSFLSQLRNSQDRGAVWSVSGASAPYSDVAHKDFARSLLGFRNQLQTDFLHELMETQDKLLAEKHDFFARRMENLCVEERPGKHSLLDIWEPSIKALQKEWKAYLGKRNHEPIIHLLEPSRGFGFGAFVSGISKESVSSRPLNWTSTQIRLDGNEFDLNSAAAIQQIVDQWLRENTPKGLKDQRSIYMSIPSGAIAAHFRQVWVENSSQSPQKENYKFHDLIWGWHPLLSLMQFLSRSRCPAVFIHTGDFPHLDMVGIWED